MRLISKFMLAAVVVFVLIAPAGAEKDGHDEQITPLLLAVHDAPMPFTGSDGRTHLVYELWITNFSSGDSRVEQVEVSGDGTLLATLDATRDRVASPARRTPRCECHDRAERDVAAVPPRRPADRGDPAGEAVSYRPRPRRRGSARNAGDDARGRRRRRRPPRAGRHRAAAARRPLHRRRLVLRRHPSHARGAAGRRPRAHRPALRRRLGAAGRREPHLRGPARRAEELHDLRQGGARRRRRARRVGGRRPARADARQVPRGDLDRAGRRQLGRARSRRRTLRALRAPPAAAA